MCPNHRRGHPGGLQRPGAEADQRQCWSDPPFASGPGREAYDAQRSLAGRDEVSPVGMCPSDTRGSPSERLAESGARHAAARQEQYAVHEIDLSNISKVVAYSAHDPTTVLMTTSTPPRTSASWRRTALTLRPWHRAALRGFSLSQRGGRGRCAGVMQHLRERLRAYVDDEY